MIGEVHHVEAGGLELGRAAKDCLRVTERGSGALPVTDEFVHPDPLRGPTSRQSVATV